MLKFSLLAGAAVLCMMMLGTMFSPRGLSYQEFILAFVGILTVVGLIVIIDAVEQFQREFERRFKLPVETDETAESDTEP